MELNEKIIERLITPEDINSINEMHPLTWSHFTKV